MAACRGLLPRYHCPEAFVEQRTPRPSADPGPPLVELVLLLARAVGLVAHIPTAVTHAVAAVAAAVPVRIFARGS
jgi:hypothetical protein